MYALELMGRFQIDVEGIIHVGANTGQEREAYRQSGAKTCLYIEPLSAVFRQLEANLAGMPGHIAVRALCSVVEGETVEMNISSNNGESSSIFPLGEHARLFPAITYVGTETLVTRTLDDVVRSVAPDTRFNLLVVDTQGADLKVLQGARQLLPRLDGVFVEISEMPLYDGGCTVEEITAFLREFDFRMKWMELSRLRYGDAFFLRSSERTLPVDETPNLALNRTASQSSLSPWSTPAGAQGGNDGNKSGKFGFHTNREVDPWWQVDLGQVTNIREIRIFNRLDNASERANRLTLWVSVDGMQWRMIHDQADQPFGGVDGRPLRVHPRHTSARFVRVQLKDTQFLHLDEVEIY